MAKASGAKHGVFYQAETTIGVAPASPNTIELPVTGCTLKIDKPIIKSGRTRSDRMITDVRPGNMKIPGDILFEFCYGAFDDLLAAALRGAWVTNVLKGGAATPGTFLIERAFTDIGQYLRFLGCHMSSWGLSIKPEAFVTGKFGVTGMSGSLETAAFDTTPAAASTNRGFDSFTGSLSEGGTSIAIVSGLDFDLNNGDQALYSLMHSGATGVSSGRSDLTGTMTAYFEDGTLLEKFLDSTESSISVTLTDLDVNSYTILLPNITYTGGDVPVNDEGPVILSLPFQAIYDATAATNVQITRTPH